MPVKTCNICLFNLANEAEVKIEELWLCLDEQGYELEEVDWQWPTK